MATQNELQDLIDQQAELIAGLRDPRPKHEHVCPKGDHIWLCASPYCEPPYGALCAKHGGGGPVTVAAKNDIRGDRVT